MPVLRSWETHKLGAASLASDPVETEWECVDSEGHASFA
jgi:hypothetical protein